MSDLKTLSMDARRGISAAELHGAVCGVAVSNPERADVMAVVELLGPDALTDQDAVAAFMEAAIAELTAEELTFALLLRDAADGDRPDYHYEDDYDDDALASLPEALSEWCAAFVAGLVAGMPVPSDDAPATDQWDALLRLGPDSQEIVTDLLAIAEIEHDSDDLTEDEQDSALTELVEYVRVAVLLLLAPPEDVPEDEFEG